MSIKTSCCSSIRLDKEIYINISHIKVKIESKFNIIAMRNGHKEYTTTIKLSINNWKTFKYVQRYTPYQDKFIKWFDFMVDPTSRYMSNLILSPLKHHYRLDGFNEMYALTSCVKDKTIYLKNKEKYVKNLIFKKL